MPYCEQILGNRKMDVVSDGTGRTTLVVQRLSRTYNIPIECRAWNDTSVSKMRVVTFCSVQTRLEMVVGWLWL